MDRAGRVLIHASCMAATTNGITREEYRPDGLLLRHRLGVFTIIVLMPSSDAIQRAMRDQ